MPKVLIILPEGFEEIETLTPLDLLRRAGATVTLASVAEGIHTTGRCGVTVHADTTLGAVLDAEYDMVVLPGGPGVKILRGDPRVIGVVRRHHAAGKPVGAICAAPTVLKDAGILGGYRFTAHTSVDAELPARLANEKVVVDRQVITSRGAGTSLAFGLALVTHLYSQGKADEIAASICV